MSWLRRSSTAILVVVTAALVAIGIAAATPTAERASTTNPFAAAGCVALDAPQVAAFDNVYNYLNSEVEPWVAADPMDSRHLVGAWQQDRWTDGGAHGLVAGYSTDGGLSWTVSPQPFTACYHAAGYSGAYLNYQRASDPWVSIGPGTPGHPSTGSTVYSVSISFNETPFGADTTGFRNVVGAAVSYDGGASWTNVQAIIDDPCFTGTFGQPGYVCNNAKAYVFNDKESVTADPVHPGVAYATWDRLVAPPASFPGFFRERAYFGQTFVSKTTDYGQHWSAPQLILSLRSQDQTIGNQIVIDPRTGALYDFFDLIQNESNAHQHRGLSVAFIKSTDGGATWTSAQVVSSLDSVGVIDSANLDPGSNTPPEILRTGDIIPEPALNPLTGQLYVVWQDSRFNGFANDEVVISTSSDGGATWSEPALVNAHTGLAAFNPSVYVSSTGAAAVTYDQWSSAPITGNEPTTLYIRHLATPGSSTSPPTFAAATAVAGSFNMLAAPWAGGYFIGDYQGLTATATGFVPFDVITNCSDGGPTTQPSCRALTSVLNPTDLRPTQNNSTDVYAFPGS
jgi:hypothetical protein